MKYTAVTRDREARNGRDIGYDHSMVRFAERQLHQKTERF